MRLVHNHRVWVCWYSLASTNSWSEFPRMKLPAEESRLPGGRSPRCLRRTQPVLDAVGKNAARLKQIAPGVTRAAVLCDPTISALIGQFAAIQGAAPSFGVEVMPIDVRDGDELQRAVAGFVRGPNDGLIVLGGPRSNAQRDLIAAMIAGHRIPAVYAARYFVTAGGLISYGPDFVDQYRRAAHYVDRILKGEKPANLPVQAPTKYELVINLKTAKALSLDVPPALLARADEVIE